MGGTSTDVSRYDGSLELVFETTTAGVSIQAPQLDISTVAAGGGSRLFLRSGMFYVGPESAGAHPGPVCYRKNGYLAVTDANLVLGTYLALHVLLLYAPFKLMLYFLLDALSIQIQDVFFLSISLLSLVLMRINLLI